MMDESKKSIDAAARPLRSPRQPRLAAGLLALMLLASLGLLLADPPRPAQAHPASAAALTCNGPCVGITNPVYDGKAEGPVGAQLTVEGANWPPGTQLAIWPGADAAACAGQPTGVAGTIPVDLAGTAQGTYTWPLSVNTLNQTYLLCARDGTTTPSPTVQVNAPSSYTVLATAPATFTFSPKTLTPGDTLTITGSNWLPVQSLTLIICANSPDCTAPIVARSFNANPDGSFSLQPTVPVGTKQGFYFVVVSSDNGALMAPSDTSSPNLLVNAPPTPTPSPSPTVTPAPTPTPTLSTGGGKGDTTVLIVVLGTLSLLFLIGGIVSLAVYMRAGP